jgi:hypothetical protein
MFYCWDARLRRTPRRQKRSTSFLIVDQAEAG